MVTKNLEFGNFDTKFATT